jgi:hypothetical protein
MSESVVEGLVDDAAAEAAVILRRKGLLQRKCTNQNALQIGQY